MIDGTYKIKVDVLFGRAEGRAVLRMEGDTVHVDVNAPVVGKQRGKGKVDGDSFVVKGSGRFILLGPVDYTLKGTVTGDDLHIDILSNKGELKLNGLRI